MPPFFDSKDIEVVSSLAGEPYGKNDPAFGNFDRLRGQLEELAQYLAYRRGVKLTRCRKERIDRRGGYAVQHNNWTDYLLMGFYPGDLGLGRTLFIKFTLHNLSWEPAIGMELDVDFVSQKHKAPGFLKEYVEKIREDGRFVVPYEQIAALDLDQIASRMQPAFERTVRLYAEAFQHYTLNKDKEVSPPLEDGPPPSVEEPRPTAGDDKVRQWWWVLDADQVLSDGTFFTNRISSRKAEDATALENATRHLRVGEYLVAYAPTRREVCAVLIANEARSDRSGGLHFAALVVELFERPVPMDTLIKLGILRPSDRQRFQAGIQELEPTQFTRIVQLARSKDFTKRVHEQGENLAPAEPTKLALRVDELAEEVAKLLVQLQDRDGGKMVGVFGHWGRGKTVLITKVLDALNTMPSQKFIQVHFHPWKYQDTPASWAYLYENVSRKYYENHKTTWIGKKWFELNRSRLLSIEKSDLGVWTWYGHLFLFVLALCSLSWFAWVLFSQNGTGLFVRLEFYASSLLATLTGYTSVRYAQKLLDYTRVQARTLFKKYFSKVSFEHVLGIQAEIEKELVTLVKTWQKLETYETEEGTKGRKILLIVDDIDRCSEDRIIAIIDSLRVMLEDSYLSRHVVVLIAVDKRILAKAIYWKYQQIMDADPQLRNVKEEEKIRAKKAEAARMVSEYLDKLFLAGVRLGMLTDRERGAVLKTMLQISPERQKQQGNGSSAHGASEEEEEIQTPPTAQGVSDENQVLEPISETAEVTSAEAGWLDQYVGSMDEVSPRQIRIFYYRYILGRGLLRKWHADELYENETLLRTLIQLLFYAMKKKMMRFSSCS